jgi:hypothetical protein
MDPDPTQNLTPFFTDFTDAKRYFLFIFFYNFPNAHHLESKNWIRIREAQKHADPQHCSEAIPVSNKKYIKTSNKVF